MSRYTGGGGYLPLTWWLANSAIDLYFSQGKYYDSGVGEGVPVTNYLSCSRASTGTARDSGGTWVSFGTNTLRITDLGLLIEDSRTNNLLNSDAPATQTTASLGTGDYTLWVQGTGSALASAGTATITGAASATNGSPNTFTVTVAGTVTVTVTGSLTRFQLEKGSYATSYIPTTGSTVTRADDLITCTSTLLTILSGSVASVYMDSNTEAPDAVNHSFWRMLGDSVSGNNFLFSPQIAAERVRNRFDGTNNLDATIGNSLTLFTGYKAVTGWDGTGRSIVGGGGTVASDSFHGGLTNPQLGGGTGQISLNGLVRRLAGWTTRLADGTMQGFSNP